MTANGIAYSAQQERLQARLAEPRTAEALERLLDKLDVVAFGVEAIDSFLHRSQDVADSLSESVEELKKLGGKDHTGSDFVSALPQLARAGTQVAVATQTQGFQNLLESGLLEQLGNPKTIENIQTVLAKLEIAAFGLTAIDSFLRGGDEITESISESFKDVRTLAESIDMDRLKPLPKLLDSLPSLIDSGVLEKLPQVIATFSMLIDSGLLRPDVIASLAEAGQALSASYEEAKRQPLEPTGLLGLLGKLRDPDTNRAITLLLEVAKQYGKKIG